MAKPSLKPQSVIPQDVKFDLVALAILEAGVRRTQKAIKNTRQRIAAKMPGGVRMTPGDIARLVQAHNRRCARRGKGISIPTWLIKQRNGVEAVRA